MVPAGGNPTSGSASGTATQTWLEPRHGHDSAVGIDTKQVVGGGVRHEHAAVGECRDAEGVGFLRGPGEVVRVCIRLLIRGDVGNRPLAFTARRQPEERGSDARRPSSRQDVNLAPAVACDCRSDEIFRHGIQNGDRASVLARGHQLAYRAVVLGEEHPARRADRYSARPDDVVDDRRNEVVCCRVSGHQRCDSTNSRDVRRQTSRVGSLHFSRLLMSGGIGAEQCEGVNLTRFATVRSNAGPGGAKNRCIKLDTAWGIVLR